MAEARRVLILGGTAEARALARRLADRPGLEVVTSLAGVTRNPELPPGKLRRGGFGGAAGLAAYLRDQAVACLVDATHPYAERISANAAAAASAAGVPRLQLLRPPWPEEPGDRWIRVADSEVAARRLPELGRRVFISSGRQGIGAFRDLTGHWFLIRLIDPPAAPLPLPAYEVTPGRAPFTVEEEVELLRRHGIEVLVSKNSGGAMTYAKIAAARRLGLPVVMLARPAPAGGPTVPEPAAADDWLRRQLTGAAR
ncbi:MAG: cobalt-precorrin-6A reductase [Kiloniellales bacterium]|nr:cobalt-precorrin-6A reductase [Kiloniellales bacterium]